MTTCRFSTGGVLLSPAYGECRCTASSLRAAIRTKDAYSGYSYDHQMWALTADHVDIIDPKDVGWLVGTGRTFDIRVNALAHPRCPSKVVGWIHVNGPAWTGMLPPNDSVWVNVASLAHRRWLATVNHPNLPKEIKAMKALAME